MIDTHAHIHFDQYKDQLDEVLNRTKEAGVGKIITVGVDEPDSQKAVDCARSYQNVFASVGIHPHEAKAGIGRIAELIGEKVVAIGECGLDYYRNLSPKDDQIKVFRAQIELALEHDLPLIFHVREAYEDFQEIIKDYPQARGVIHSFNADAKTAAPLVELGFYFGLNGIMTFTKDSAQLEAAKLIPLNQLLLETDCPFLSPVPHRGKVNEPANIPVIAKFLAELRGESMEELAKATTANANQLFSLD